jgi:hypothetical protein
MSGMSQIRLDSLNHLWILCESFDHRGQGVTFHLSPRCFIPLDLRTISQVPPSKTPTFAVRNQIIAKVDSIEGAPG